MARWLRRTGYAAVVVAALSLLPPVQARTRALALVLEALGVPMLPRPFAPPVTRAETVLGDVAGDLYTDGRTDRGLLLVHGAALQGKDDPRLVRLANAVARAGFDVFVPALVLAERRFVSEDLERIVASGAALADRTGSPIEVLGISYGGSFALVAAADERLSGLITQVAVFGAYFDLAGVIQAVTTGSSLVGERSIPWNGDPNAVEILERYVVDLAPAEARNDLGQALDGRFDPDGLPDDARAVYELVSNRDPRRTFDLVRALAPEARALFERVSPSSVAERIDVPVIAMHSRDDPAVPYGEALRLVRGLPETRLVTVGSFRHVDFEVGSPGTWAHAARDLLGAWRFATWLANRDTGR